MKARLSLVAVAASASFMASADSLDPSFEFSPGSPGKLTWQSEPDRAYNLWFAASLTDPFTHVDGFPKDGTLGPMEHQFDSGTRGFFRIDSAPEGFALIPAGSFEMGDSFAEGDSWEGPVHTVFVSDFYMATHEVTVDLWNEVCVWGWANGYGDLPYGDGKANNHAVHSIIWWDAMKWCNARSEKEGLQPCYFLNSARTLVYRVGDLPAIDNTMVDWTGNGYRLPTEAEWEKAARGGLDEKRFPWGDTISHEQANYFSDRIYPYDVSPTRGSHPATCDMVSPYTTPAGSCMANNYGLQDMAGNVWEWCWDAFDLYSYMDSPAVDPRGPGGGDLRIVRGGAWTWAAYHARCSYRRIGWIGLSYSNGSWGRSDPGLGWDGYNEHGLRVVRSR